MSVVMHAEQRGTPVLERFEHWALVALAFVLPLFEAPKNVLCVVFLAIWIANRWRARPLQAPWDRWDTLIACWIASGFIVAAFAGIRDGEWRGTVDLVRYGSVLWLLKRSRYPDRIWFALTAAILSGTAAGLVWSYYGLVVTGEHQFLTLNSVGHVNHSSGYLSIVCSLAVMVVLALWRGSGPWSRAAGIALVGLLVVSLFWMQSRASVGAAFVAVFLLPLVYAVRRGKSVGPVVLAAVATLAAVFLISPQVIQKNAQFLQKDYFLNGREEIWRAGLSAWREFPYFGVGMGNYGRVDDQRLESWASARGETYDRRALLSAPHGHSLYVNALAERGLLGFGALFAILAAWAASLVRRVPDIRARPLVWIYWGGSSGAWLITVVAGTLNTTLHHEQALLSALLLGGWLSLSLED